MEDDDEYGCYANNALNLPTWEPKSREDMVKNKNAIESSKGCSLYSLSRKESSTSLHLAFAVGKRVHVLRWIHQEEWISLNADTAEGFEDVMELHASDTPVKTITILKAKQKLQVLVGTRSSFELLRVDEPTRRLFSMPHGTDGAISAIQVESNLISSIFFALTKRIRKNLIRPSFQK